MSAVSELIRRGSFEEVELASIADQLHKLAGTAAMFGEGALGDQARQFEVGLGQWSEAERADRIRPAAQALLDAA